MSRNILAEVKKSSEIVAEWLLTPELKEKEYRERYELAQNPQRCKVEVAQSGGGGYSDPVGNIATKCADISVLLKKWLDLVAEVENGLPVEKQIFLRLKRKFARRSKKQGYLAEMQFEWRDKYFKKTGKEAWIDHRMTFWRWWDEILGAATVLAAKRDLI